MAVDYFLKIDGIEGESKDDKHTNEIEILSFSWGMTQQGTFSAGGGGGAGKVSVQDINFAKYMDKASTKLMQHCTTGKHIPKAVLTLRKAGETPHEYLKVTFEDLLVSSYQVGGSGGGGDVPTDSFSINFAKFEAEYAEQKADGTKAAAVTAKYDLKANKAA